MKTAPAKVWIDLHDESAYSTDPEEGETEYVRADARLLLALATLEAHEWIAANDACIQRVGDHEVLAGHKEPGWLVLSADGGTEAVADTLPDAVKALKAKLYS